MIQRYIVVAKSKYTGKYAYLGRQTGMGRTIEQTEDIMRARNFVSSAGVMAALGGHYTSYDAVRVSVNYEELEKLVYANLEEVLRK